MRLLPHLQRGSHSAAAHPAAPPAGGSLQAALGCDTAEDLQVRQPPRPPPPPVPAGLRRTRGSLCRPITPLTASCAAPSCSAQDLLSCLLLSEAVYKAAEGPPAAAAAALDLLRAELPPGLAPLHSVQFSRRAAEHRWAA